MPTIGLFNKEANKVGEIQLNDQIFAVEVNTDAIHQVVVAQLANKRTGRARQGSIRAPQWIKGGVVFAPKPRDYRMSIPKTMRRVAITSALTSKVLDNNMIVLESLELAAPKTKEMVNVLNAFEAKKTLIVTAGSNENVYKSARNIQGVAVLPVNNINVYDLLKFEKLIITKEAVNKIEEVYA